MGNYIIRRLIQGVPVLFLISGIVFLVVYFIPGDAAMVVLGQSATPERLAVMRDRMGLNEPLPVRYVLWLKEILQGDFGTSLVYQRPVWGLIGHGFPITLYLTLFSMFIAVVISVPAGVLAALKRNTWIDLVATTWAFLGVSVPGFWLGIMLVYLFGVRLQWVPLQGYIGPRDDLTDSIKTMALPAFTLGVFLSGPLTRYLRSSMLQTMAQEFVLVARAKGLSERKVLMRHIL